MKTKSAFFCQNCGFESSKWAGKCPSCNEWNTFVEEVKEKPSAKADIKELWTEEVNKANNKAKNIADIQSEEEIRYVLPDDELNRTLGGGLVQGSVTLIAGDPGIGKSTLFLQCALQAINLRVLYVSGEESMHQIKMRADRIEIGRAHV